MNKNEILDQLMDIRELTIGADSPGDNLQADLMEIRKIASKSIEEVYSKPVMPKVFDEFATHFNLTKQQDEQGLDGALEEVYMMYMLGRSEFDDLEEYMRAHGDEEFYTKCVDALVNSYEVDDDE